MAPACVCGGPRPLDSIGKYAPLCATCAAKLELHEAAIKYELARQIETVNPCSFCHGTGGASETRKLADGGELKLTGACLYCEGTGVRLRSLPDPLPG